MGLGVPLDALNTRLPCDRAEMRGGLRRASRSQNRHSFAVAAIINHAVAQFAPTEVFVAIGAGSKLFIPAAIADHADKAFLAIDDLGTNPSRLAALRSLGPRGISLCTLRVDPKSSATGETLRQLAAVEPYLAENACVLVENTNEPSIHAACLEFVQSSANQYRVLLDERTGRRCALTFGDGVFLLQLLGRNSVAGAAAPKHLRPAA